MNFSTPCVPVFAAPPVCTSMINRIFLHLLEGSILWEASDEFKGGVVPIAATVLETLYLRNEEDRVFSLHSTTMAVLDLPEATV